MTPGGRIYFEFGSRDLNAILRRARPGVLYSEGVFLIEQALPMGASATCVAVPYQEKDEILITVPFDKIRGKGLGVFAGALAKTLWGKLSGQIEDRVDQVLTQRGFPRDTVTVTEAVLGGGRRGGLIRVSLPRLNAWLAARKTDVGLRFELEGLHCGPASVQLCLQSFVD